MSNKLLYSGKAKDIFSTDDEQVILARYKDQATAFNGVKKEQIAGKGVLNNQISSFIFEKRTDFYMILVYNIAEVILCRFWNS